jgi:hypothetical protein
MEAVRATASRSDRNLKSKVNATEQALEAIREKINDRDQIEGESRQWRQTIEETRESIADLKAKRIALLGSFQCLPQVPEDVREILRIQV